jgi:hypothetical protein
LWLLVNPPTRSWSFIPPAHPCSPLPLTPPQPVARNTVKKFEREGRRSDRLCEHGGHDRVEVGIWAGIEQDGGEDGVRIPTPPHSPLFFRNCPLCLHPQPNAMHTNTPTRFLDAQSQVHDSPAEISGPFQKVLTAIYAKLTRCTTLRHASSGLTVEVRFATSCTHQTLSPKPSPPCLNHSTAWPINLLIVREIKDSLKAIHH